MEYHFESLLRTYVQHITGEDCAGLAEERILEISQAHNLKVHFLKRLENPRISWPVGKLSGIRPESILDIGSGKGWFLWHILKALPGIKITSVDIRPKQVERIRVVAEAADLPIAALVGDVHSLPFADQSFEAVTMLEVLEHVTNPAEALYELCRVSLRWVIVTVPSRADENPEHIHLFDQESLRDLFEQAGVSSLRFEQDRQHIYVLAQV